MIETNDNVSDILTARSNKDRRFLIPERLKDARKFMRLSQEELGKEIGVSRQAISQFERGDRNPDARTLVGIQSVLKQPIEFFITQEFPEVGKSSPKFYRKFGSNTIRRREACDTYAEWFVQIVKQIDNFINYPPVNIPSYDLSDLKEDTIDEAIDSIAENVRKYWGLGLGPISNVISLLEANGVISCRYEMTGEKVEAFSFWNDSRPFIFLASEKKAGARIRFDLAHELGHLVLHRNIDKEVIEDKYALKKIEQQADRFAGAFLLPRHSFGNEIFMPRLEAFVSLKQRWKVSIQAMIYRCANLELFDESQILNLRKQISFRKWRTNEPLDDPSIIPIEQPKLLSKVFKILTEGGYVGIDEFKTIIPINPTFIEKMLNLDEGTLNKSKNYNKILNKFLTIKK